MPIRNWLTMIHTPSAENTVTCGSGPSVGATMIVVKAARPIFTRVGNERLPNTGALAINARIRTNGHRNAVSQAFSCAYVTENMTGNESAQLTSDGMLVSVWRR